MQPYMPLLKNIHFQNCARTTLTDIGTFTEESSILSFWVLNRREVRERPEDFGQASVTVTSPDVERVQQGLDIWAHQPQWAVGAAIGQRLRFRQHLGPSAAHQPGPHGFRGPARMAPLGSAVTSLPLTAGLRADLA